MDVYSLARRELPEPPARVLEIGCGSGETALALAAAGYDVVAVDPKAPEGSIFRRVTIEELDELGLFDGALASLSLHHLVDLDIALVKVHSLLRPGSPFVVREFAWDRADEATAAWYYAQLGEAGGLERWRSVYDDLHGFEPIVSALRERFRERSFALTPYLYDHRLDPAVEPLERRLIDEGALQAMGFVYTGVA